MTRNHKEEDRMALDLFQCQANPTWSSFFWHSPNSDLGVGSRIVAPNFPNGVQLHDVLYGPRYLNPFPSLHGRSLDASADEDFDVDRISWVESEA